MKTNRPPQAMPETKRCHLFFVCGMTVALGGFVLIWSPQTWQMVVGASISFLGTLAMVKAAWR